MGIVMTLHPPGAAFKKAKECSHSRRRWLTRSSGFLRWYTWLLRERLAVENVRNTRKRTNPNRRE
jgi:hypothetical protein